MLLINDDKSITLLLRTKPRGRTYRIGRKRHYRKDSGCAHVNAMLASIKPEALRRVRIDGWGGKPPAAA